MTSKPRNNLQGTFSAVAEAVNDNDNASRNNPSALSPQSIALARAAVISEMTEVLICPSSPVPHKLVIVAAMADFGNTDDAGLVRSQAVDQMARYMLDAAPAPVTQSISRFLIERLNNETDVNIRQDVASYLGDAVAKNVSGADKKEILTALSTSAKNDSEHDVRAAATQGLGKSVLTNSANIDVLETTGLIADVARTDTNRYVRWGAAHLVKKILMSSAADQIPVTVLAQRLTGVRPLFDSADIPGQIIGEIEREAMEDSEIKIARKKALTKIPSPK